MSTLHDLDMSEGSHTADPQAPYAAPESPVPAWARDGWTVYPAAAPKSLCIKVLASYASDEEAAALAERVLALLNTPAPPLAGAAGEGEKPLDADRAQALRDDVRKKYNAALPRVLEAGRWFRIEAVLDEADAQAKELATLRARLAEETRAAAEAEREKLHMVKALKLAKKALATCYNVTDYPGDGASPQDAALRAVAKALSAAGPLLGDEGKEGREDA